MEAILTARKTATPAGRSYPPARLLEAENKFNVLNALACADIALCRHLLDPWEEDVMKLDAAQIAAVVGRLNATIEEMHKYYERIKGIKAEAAMVESLAAVEAVSGQETPGRPEGAEIRSPRLSNAF